jgi:hypothetical protein
MEFRSVILPRGSTYWIRTKKTCTRCTVILGTEAALIFNCRQVNEPRSFLQDMLRAEIYSVDGVCHLSTQLTNLWMCASETSQAIRFFCHVPAANVFRRYFDSTSILSRLQSIAWLDCQMETHGIQPRRWEISNLGLTRVNSTFVTEALFCVHHHSLRGVRLTKGSEETVWRFYLITGVGRVSLWSEPSPTNRHGTINSHCCAL